MVGKCVERGNGADSVSTFWCRVHQQKRIRVLKTHRERDGVGCGTATIQLSRDIVHVALDSGQWLSQGATEFFSCPIPFFSLHQVWGTLLFRDSPSLNRCAIPFFLPLYLVYMYPQAKLERSEAQTRMLEEAAKEKDFQVKAAVRKADELRSQVRSSSSCFGCGRSLLAFDAGDCFFVQAQRIFLVC